MDHNTEYFAHNPVLHDKRQVHFPTRHPWSSNTWRPLFSLLLVAGFFIIGSLWSIKLAVAHPTLNVSPTATAAFDCSNISTVPPNECRGLVALYQATDGPQWRQQTNWLSTKSTAPCDWYGVRCDNGHVTQLLLAGNGLSGTIPITIGYLSELTVLHLENNRLAGNLGKRVCQVTEKLKEGSIAYNMLAPRFRTVTDCLNKIEPNWLATQTLAPRELTITEFYTNALRLAWSPIPYTEHGGYYEISYSTTMTGTFTVHGTTADKSIDTYLVDGLLPGQRYFFKVRTYTPPHDEQKHELYSTAAKVIGMTKARAGHVLLAAYFPADNDLSSQIEYVIKRMQRGTQYNPNVTVLLLVDGLGDNNTRLLQIKDGVVQQTGIIGMVWGRKELDTADPDVLQWFLTYARNAVPANRVVVSLMGHGLALAPELQFGEAVNAAQNNYLVAQQNGTFPALPRDWFDTPNDVTSNSAMSTTDVAKALMAATDNGKNPFDVVFLDQCFQGNLDALYEIHKTATLFVASPNYAWLVAAYDRYIMGFSPRATAEELGFVILQQYEITLNDRHPNAILGVRGRDIPPIADAMSSLADALTAVVNDGQQTRIASAVRQSNYVDTTQCGRRNLQLGPPDELIGIEGLAQQLYTEFSQGDRYGVIPALDQLYIAMQQVIKRGRSGYPYIAPDQYWDYRDSLTVLAPLPRNSPSDVAWRASIYRPDAPFTATWTLDPTQPMTVTESLAFVKEGRWDDFLSVWFEDLTPTVGQWCNYIPPEQVVLDDAEVLTLTVAVEAQNSLSLNWTPSDDGSAIEYLLYIDSPLAVSWELTETLDIAETTARFTALDAGTYDLRVLARNRDDEFVATSNIATVDVSEPLSPNERQIYLPLVIR